MLSKLGNFFLPQQAKEMVLELIRDQGGFREVRNEYGSRIGGNEGIDVSKNTQKWFHANV